jgi:hypothetical protein
MQMLAEKPVEMHINDEGEEHTHREENFLTILAGAFDRAKDTKDSIYDVNTPKVE